MNRSDLAIFGGTPILEYPEIRPSPFGLEEIELVTQVLNTGLLSKAGNGPYVRKFEKEFAEYQNVPYALTTTSGTTALHTAVRALGISFGDEVLVPSLTFVSSASVVMQEGAKPVFVDIDEDDFNIDCDDLIKKITPKTKAIVVVHLYGSPAQMNRIIEIAREYKLLIIEDCAQAHGARYRDRPVGTFGDIACFSFYQSKNLSCGEGGMIITSSRELYDRCRELANHGQRDEVTRMYDYAEVGFNYHMTEMQAAVGLVQLRKLDVMNVERKQKSRKIIEALGNTALQFQKQHPKSTSAFYSLTALLPRELSSKRDWFIDAVKAENCDLNRIYPIPLHKTTLFRDSGSACPKAEDVCSRLFNFYVNPGISDSSVDATCVAVRKILTYLGYEQ